MPVPPPAPPAVAASGPTAPTLPGAPPPPPPAARPGADVAALIAPIEQAGDGPALPDVTATKATAAVKTVDAGPVATEPGEMIPQVGKKRPPKIEKTKPTKRLRPGDLVCGECGEGNAQTRKFCSRCGASLATAEKVKTPWWRRIIPKRKPKTMEAGARPGQGGVKAKRKLGFRGAFKKVRRVGSIIFILLGILYGVYTPFRNWVNARYTSTKNSVMSVIKPQFVPINPTDVQQSSIDAANPDCANERCVGGNAFDLATNTYWQADPADGEPTLIIEFANEADLRRLIVTSGDTANFAKKARPAEIRLLYSTDESQVITLKDQADPQTIELKNASNVTSIEIHVTQTYDPVGAGPFAMALTEMEFLRKK